jgi:8-oxo-dGTP pyrophosphatase MutT (NUDIX family)
LKPRSELNQLLMRTEVLSPKREIVAVVLSWRGRIGLFKRGPLVGFDAGLWHCITGYLEQLEPPVQAATRELHEESGLTIEDLGDWCEAARLA